jgi:hypothetical protein
MTVLATSTQNYAETAGALNAAKLISSFVINNASVITSKRTIHGQLNHLSPSLSLSSAFLVHPFFW